MEVLDQGVVVRPVDDPNGKSIRVSLARVRRCPDGVPNDFWPARKKTVPKTDSDQEISTELLTEPIQNKEPQGEVWSGRLRPRGTG